MVHFRAEHPNDLTAIHAVHAACFPTEAEANLVDRLRDVGRLAVSWVAEADGIVIGHVAFSPVTTASGLLGIGLAPVAVMEGHWRQGIAEGLVRRGLEECRSAGYGWVVVLGEPGYYRRFGFRPAAEYGLSDEYGGGVAFQALELVSGAVPLGSGCVRFSPEFASLA